mmetsp:Transcript_24840/g.58279  ORF Transcript_24840/g.58279 Transcript_24840/m.58279 type:complete len:216 (-) Transcript_24840:144-791(-)|eukprot:CAMPEP_0197185682 /NCGR_PEP_ID=MMETSP1423-20130617/12417_1 /TAXON_ID=476441 /ORGANISM="Pseudo-nitzschia heimii, Strain UNC1101" /LENGTH=215 /DNA_ID=CAMNT_0042636813 /DNA_START=119 /DNA_END=766 /DNA_ORIENTATION=-
MMMKFVYSAVIMMVLTSNHCGVQAFQPQPQKSTSVTRLHDYVPSGFTPEQYKKFKQQEKKKAAAKKNLGGMGPRGFKSRSMQSFQEAMERGEATHLMPVFNAKERVKRGEIKVDDIPYMQRGGNWDNSDVKGAKKKSWLKSDKEYSDGGFKKEQSVSIFGKGDGLDWSGKRARTGPSESVVGAAPKFGRNYKAPNVNNINGKKDPPKKKKMFGFF